MILVKYLVDQASECFKTQSICSGLQHIGIRRLQLRHRIILPNQPHLEIRKGHTSALISTYFVINFSMKFLVINIKIILNLFSRIKII